MTYNPVIAAARRAAKQIARDTGASYQSSLDLVARQAGRNDWDAYLASPAEVPFAAAQAPRQTTAAVEEEEDLYVDGPEHARNMGNIVLTGVATIPSLVAMVAATSPNTPLISRDLQVDPGMLKILVLIIALWGFATMMAVTLFSGLAVHPDVPEIGRNGTREQFTSLDLARLTMVLAAIAGAIGFLTRGQPTAQPTVVGIAVMVGLVAGGAAHLVGHRVVRRVLALVAANGALTACFLAMGALHR